MKRPTLVLSPGVFNAKVGLALVAPITSRVRGHGFEVAVRTGGRFGEGTGIGSISLFQHPYDGFQQAAHVCHAADQTGFDVLHTDRPRAAARRPVGDHRAAGITKPQFPRQRRFRHTGHTDHAAAVSFQPVYFGGGLQPRTLCRMRSKELHYFDHPRFGVVALITPYKSPQATPETDIPVSAQP